VKARIAAFHQDDQGHWVATLSCSHTVHMRHQPPWTVRPWVLTLEGRASYVGVEVDCTRCDEVTSSS
jgi:hypothetical protein